MRAWIALTLTTSLWASGCGGAPAEPTPDGAILESTKALKKNDLRAFLDATVPQDAIGQMAAEWDKARKEAPSQREKDQFQQQMTMLTNDGAEEFLFSMAAPQLKKMKPQIAGMSGFISGMAEMQLEQEAGLGSAEKEMAKKMVSSLGTWLESNDITDEGKLKKAIGIVCKTARKLNLKTLDQVGALSFDQMLGKGDIAMAGLKDLLDVYGMDVNGFLKSVSARTVTTTGDTAIVTVTFRFLGEQHKVDTEMVRFQGRWFGKSTLEQQAAKTEELQASF